MAVHAAERENILDAASRRRAAGGAKTNFTTREIADALGMSESSVKRWANEGRIAAVRTVGGHRRITIDEALRFVRETGLCIVRPDILGIEYGTIGSARREGDLQATGDKLHAALVEGDAEAARRLVLGEYYSGRTVAQICDGPVSYALGEIGCLWQENEEKGIFVEHRAMDICFDVFRRLQTLLPESPADRPLALGCAPNLDIYALPTLMASVVLQENGCTSVNLGASTPLRSLRRAAQEHRPRLVWIAMTSGPDDNPPESIVGETIELAKAAGAWGGSVVFGGRHVPRDLRLPRAANMRHLESFGDLARTAAALVA